MLVTRYTWKGCSDRVEALAPPSIVTSNLFYGNYCVKKTGTE